MRTARLGLEGCESFVDDLIGCRVLYSVRDALLHRSLEIQPWHFPIRYYKRVEAASGSFFSFFCSYQAVGSCSPTWRSQRAQLYPPLPSVRACVVAAQRCAVGGARAGWPSGPRRETQVLFSSEAWVRTPLQSCQHKKTRAPARALLFFPGRFPAPAMGV